MQVGRAAIARAGSAPARQRQRPPAPRSSRKPSIPIEIGAKLDLFDRKLQINVAGYVSDYKNMQQNLTLPGGPTGNQTITGNVPGGALIKGIEMDGTLRVTSTVQNHRVAGGHEFAFPQFRGRRRLSGSGCARSIIRQIV